MKKIGLLLLLSASYAGLLTFVFSTDYSRENSFLLPVSSPSPTAKHFESPVMSELADLSERIAAVQDAQQPTPITTPAQAGEQSPESAH